MKLIRGNKINDNKIQKVYHSKNPSEDMNNYNKIFNNKNYFVSKFLNQSNKIKNENITTENLPNLKMNIQNIFSNDDNRKKAIQYLIKIRKDKSISPPISYRSVLTSEDDIKFKENEKDISISRYYNNNYNCKYNYNQRVIRPVITSSNLSQRNIDINQKDKEKIIERYINNNKNFVNYNNNFFSNNDYNNNRNNINQKNNYLSINTNTYSHFYNNLKNQSNNINLNINNNNSNKTYNNIINNNNNPINNLNNYDNYNNSQMNNFAFANYMNNMKKHNLSKIKKKILDEYSIEENNNKHHIKNNSMINPIINKNNINYNYNIINKDNKSFYIHKNPPIYTKVNLNSNRGKNNHHLNSNLIIEEVRNNNKYILLENRKTNYERNDDRDIHVNTLAKQKKFLVDQFKINENKKLFKTKFNNKEVFQIKKIQLQINSNKKTININNNFRFNKDKLIMSNQKGISIHDKRNKKENKLNFNDDKEIINYIKNKYNMNKINEFFNKEEINISNNSIKKKDTKKSLGLMSVEEGNKLKENNEQLLSEIEKIKYENKQYKKELDDIRNQFNELTKEIVIIKEENEKLKDNIINNMMNDDNKDVASNDE